MAGATMPSGRPPDSRIVLSGATSGPKATDAPAIRDDELLSEFTSEPARWNVEAPGHHLNFTVHERTSIPSASPARSLASARRELFGSLTAQLRSLRARVARMPEVPMWIGQIRNVRRLPANTALSFAGGIATGGLIMWIATAQPSTIVPPATPAPVREPAVSAARGLPASPLDPHSAQENVRARSTSQPPAIVSPAVTSGRRNDVVDQPARPSRAKSTPAASRKNAARSPSATRNTSPGSYRGSLVLTLRATGRACVCERRTGRIDATHLGEPSGRIARGPHRSRRISALVVLDPGCRQ